MAFFNRHNFHKHTYCVFHHADFAQIAHLSPNYKSKSGSVYYFTEEGVYRLSNHWGRAANCKWRLESAQATSGVRLGFAAWTAFHRDNDTEKLYYIDYSANGVEFKHKDDGNYNGQRLRTAPATMQRIRQVRNLLDSPSWTKYYPGNPEDLQKCVTDALIQTDLPLAQIKAQFYNTEK